MKRNARLRTSQRAFLFVECEIRLRAAMRFVRNGTFAIAARPLCMRKFRS
jgi:hypothetical protein